MSASSKVWVNGLPPQCEGDDLNGFNKENNSLISGSGQILDADDNQQTHRAVSHYAAGGDFYTDSGTSGNILLNVTVGHISPANYFTGMRCRFFPSAINATNVSSVNVAGLGVKTVTTNATNSTIIIGALTPSREATIVYDGAKFVLQNNGAFFSDFNEVSAVTPTELTILDGATLSTAELNTLDGARISTAELNELNHSNGLEVSSLTVTGSVSAGSPTFLTRSFTSFRIGNLVNVSFNIFFSDVGGMSGDVEVTGFPVIASGNVGISAYVRARGLTGSVAINDHIGFQFPLGVQPGRFTYSNPLDSPAPTSQFLQASDLTNSSRLECRISYVANN